MASLGPDSAAAQLDESKEMRLEETFAEKKKYAELGELYSIMQATEHLETAYVRDLIKPDQYQAMCQKLIGQFKMQETTLKQMGALKDVRSFMEEYSVRLPQSYKRLVEDCVPATMVHATADDRAEPVLVAETTSNLITAIDLMKLNVGDVDQVQPVIAAACESLSRHAWLGPDFEWKGKLVDW